MLRSALSALLLAMVAGCAATPAEHRYAEATSLATSHCVTSGTRIPSREGDCFVAGRSHSYGDLRRAHPATAADALRDLDPGILIRQ